MTAADPFACPGATGSQFTTTHWSVVLNAAQEDTSESAAALESLCRAYWHPLYAYIRRRGHDPHAAQDLTQEFFSRLLGKSYLRSVDPRKGKFRSFLLAALEHFLANEWRNAHAQKRGGNTPIIPLVDGSAEEQYVQLSNPSLTPEQLFEREWAMAILDKVLSRLQQEFEAAGKAGWFQDLKVFLTGEKRTTPYASLAAKLGTTEAALKMSVTRLKRRYGELLRQEISSTVARPEEVAEELRHLLAALSL
jgi:RNA polymerase sigma factor (sigma-70 family)